MPKSRKGHEILTVKLRPAKKDWIRERAKERSMSMSEYARATIEAGRKQLVELEEEAKSGDGVALEEKVINAVPTDPEDAKSHEEIADQVLGEVEDQIFELLDTDDRIDHSAAHGGYYFE